MADQYQEQQAKTLKKNLEGWRPALLALKPVFLWEQNWHPLAIISTSSLLHLVLWLLDLNALTMIAVVGVFACLVDFIVPIIFNSVCNPNVWNDQMDKMFEDVCKSIVRSYNNVLHQLNSYYSMRATSPHMFYGISIVMLLTIAWISSAINNIVVMYLLTTVTLLWPGIRHHDIFNALLSMVTMKSKAPKEE